MLELTQDKINLRNNVNVKVMNNIVEIKYVSHKNTKATIQKLNDNEVLVLSTGEIKRVQHIENRSQNKLQVSQSLKRLRDLINTNITDVNNCKWITLTYKENMQDAKRLYDDFRKFIKRLRYTCKEYKIEYIVAMEPQGRGAWHSHLILIFDRQAPFIANSTIEQLWGNGFTKTNKLANIDNIGAYLTAYLGDMELTEENKKLLNENGVSHYDIKDVKEIDDIKLKKPKKFIKGGRLYLYPPKFNIYRNSNGIRRPTEYNCRYMEAKRKEGLHEPSFKKSICIRHNDFSNLIIYEQYNKKRKTCQTDNNNT